MGKSEIVEMKPFTLEMVRELCAKLEAQRIPAGTLWPLPSLLEKEVSEAIQRQFPNAQFYLH